MENERYLTPEIYISKDTFQPKGVCYGNICKQSNMSVHEKIVMHSLPLYVNGRKIGDAETISGRQTDIKVYLTDGNFGRQNMSVFIIPSGANTDCMNAVPPCRDFVSSDGAKWHRSGDFILAEMPLAEHSAVEGFQTIYPENSIRFDTVPHIGKADGVDVALTFDDGGFTYHKTSLSDKYLIPGEIAYVSYKMRGVDGYYTLGFIDFQTNIFTSAAFIGCGLVQKTKVYKNPLRPKLGYTCIYLPYEGGEGKLFRNEWAFEKDYRCLVDYRGEKYWLKSIDFAEYLIGERVRIVKETDEMPLLPKEELTHKDADTTLSEDNDMIVPELFYQR